MDPGLLEELSKIYFVLGNTILGDDGTAIIYSLLNDFNQIMKIKSVHNMELSQYFDVSKNIIEAHGLTQCQNCEIVLKYNDNCLGPISCQSNYGSVKFFLKQQQGGCFTYVPIYVVRINYANQVVNPSVYYINNAVKDELDQKYGVALNKVQMDSILNYVNNGYLSVVQPLDVNHSLRNLNNLLHNIKNVGLNTQLENYNSSGLYSDSIPVEMINLANVISTNLPNYHFVVVPGNDPIQLQPVTFENNFTRNPFIDLDANLIVQEKFPQSGGGSNDDARLRNQINLFKIAQMSIPKKMALIQDKKN
jgi:hypothetical protein